MSPVRLTSQYKERSFPITLTLELYQRIDSPFRRVLEKSYNSRNPEGPAFTTPRNHNSSDTPIVDTNFPSCFLFGDKQLSKEGRV